MMMRRTYKVFFYRGKEGKMSRAAAEEHSFENSGEADLQRAVQHEAV